MKLILVLVCLLPLLKCSVYYELKNLEHFSKCEISKPKKIFVFMFINDRKDRVKPTISLNCDDESIKY